MFYALNSNDPDSVCVQNYGIHNLAWIVETGPVEAEPGFCSDTAYMSIQFFENPELSFDIVNESAEDAADGSITVSINNGTPPYIIEWWNGESSETIGNLTAGVYSVEVTDNNGCSVYEEILVSVETGVNATVQNGIKVFPNPANTYIYIISDEEIHNLKVFDMLGRTVFESQIMNPYASFNVSEFGPGPYLVQLDFGTYTKSLKIVKM